MVELDNFKVQLATYKNPLQEVRAALDLVNKQQRIQELEREMEAPDFWNDPSVSQKKMQELKSMKDDVATYSTLERGYEDIETMIEMGYEENDASLIPEIQEMLDDFIQTYEAIHLKTLLSGEYDKKKAIVSLHAGAGGTESCDWAAMLFRMYSRWADKKGFHLTVLDSLDGEEAGIKSITFEVEGENAYGYLIHLAKHIGLVEATSKLVKISDHIRTFFPHRLHGDNGGIILQKLPHSICQRCLTCTGHTL